MHARLFLQCLLSATIRSAVFFFKSICTGLFARLFDCQIVLWFLQANSSFYRALWITLPFTLKILVGLLVYLVWDLYGTILSDAQWKCSNSTASTMQSSLFDDAAWKPAVELASYGKGPWRIYNLTNANGPVPTAASKWIWTSKTSETIMFYEEAYCTLKLN